MIVPTLAALASLGGRCVGRTNQADAAMCPRLPRRQCDWNAELGIDLARDMIVADDLVGGAFAINGTELGDQPGRVHYFAPDALEWEDTELGHSAFVSGTFEGDLEAFSGTMRWPGC